MYSRWFQINLFVVPQKNPECPVLAYHLVDVVLHPLDGRHVEVLGDEEEAVLVEGPQLLSGERPLALHGLNVRVEVPGRGRDLVGRPLQNLARLTTTHFVKFSHRETSMLSRVCYQALKRKRTPVL